MRQAALLSILVLAFSSGCQQKTDLAGRIKTAGGIESLKADCLQLVTRYETSGLKHISLSRLTNQPATIAALAPVGLQVGRQGDVILVHLGFAIGPRPYGLYVAPKGCPSDFLPDRPPGERISKIADGVFEYAQ